uniref:polysaccharide biosynthesis protein n=1 Tax=Clostridium sp. TaxID=1506 RepID=UPI002603FFDA
LIDDNKAKIGRNILGIKILGNREKLLEIVEDKNIEVIIIALPSTDESNRKEIIDICKKTSCNIKIVPSFYEFIDENIPLKSIKNVDIEDLLGRKQIQLNNEEISNYINNKTVLVTGGGGSIGSELCRQISKFGPKKLIIFDIYENNAYDIQNELKYNYPNLDLEVLIGSVRDRNRIEDIYKTYKPNLVFHAAAHKHVPLMEDSPFEAIKNNVFGTYNVAEFASKYKVERFVLISTDKAVNPTNIMGATKRLCEMIIQSMEKISSTKYVAVRFGNVLGSNGSVIPLFKKQIENGGPVTLTHKDITRFFMTIPEAAQLVLQSGAFAKGGEIFILDMGKPVKIYDLASDLIRLSGLKLGEDIEIKVTGLRPGEKLYEELLMSEEGIKETKHKSIFIGKPIFEDIDALRKNLKDLEEVVKENNKLKLNLKMKEIVKTYKSEAIFEVATDEI